MRARCAKAGAVFRRRVQLGSVSRSSSVRVNSVTVACAAAGNAALAAEAYELLAPHVGHVDGDLATWNGPVARSLALLAAVIDRPDNAVRHYESAIEMCRRMGTLPWLAYRQFELGSVLRARGRANDPRPASALFDQSLDAARRMGRGRSGNASFQVNRYCARK
jgi:hypothetical protein